MTLVDLMLVVVDFSCGFGCDGGLWLLWWLMGVVCWHFNVSYVKINSSILGVFKNKILK